MFYRSPAGRRQLIETQDDFDLVRVKHNLAVFINDVICGRFRDAPHVKTFSDFVESNEGAVPGEYEFSLENNFSDLEGEEFYLEGGALVSGDDELLAEFEEKLE